MRPTALIAVVTAVATLVAGAALAGTGTSTPLSRPSAARAVVATGARAPEVGAEAVAPDAPREIGDPVVTRDRPASFDGDLRDLPVVLQPPVPPGPEPEAPAGDDATLKAPAADPVAQTVAPRVPAPAATVSDGISRTSGGNGWPPDTNIDVGPSVVIETVNTGFAIYDKSSRAQLASNSFNGLISGTGTSCDNANYGDPVVLYDSIADRWILSDFAWASFANGPFYECLAVSKTSDPVSGGWWFYAFETGQSPASVTPATRDYLPDYPKLGVWPDAIFMTANLFAPDGNASNARLVAFDRAALEAGQAADAVRIDLAWPSFNLLPANARAQTGLPPVGTPGYMVETWPGNQLSVWRFRVDWTTPANSAVLAQSLVAVAPYAAVPDYVPTPADPSHGVDSLQDGPMMQLQYTNLAGAESLWLTHSVGTGSPTVASPRWYQVDVTDGVIATSPVQQATWAPGGGLHRFMGSLAVDRLGDVALGYSIGNAATNPGIRYAGRLAGDAAGTFSLGEQTLQAGGGAQTTYDRWGDYSSMTLDPADGCTFWYANEYYAATGTNWHTAIGSFAYPTCPSAPVATAPPVVTAVGGAAVAGAALTTTDGTWSGSPTSYAYQWQRNAAARWTPIDGATSNRYTAADADVGARVRCIVTSENGSGRASSASSAVSVSAVTPPTPPPTEPASTPAPDTRVRAIDIPRPRIAQLANGLAVTLTPPGASRIVVVVRARGRVIGRLATAVRGSRVTLRVPIVRAYRRTAAPGGTLSVRITGTTSTGTAITPVALSVRLR